MIAPSDYELACDFEEIADAESPKALAIAARSIDPIAVQWNEIRKYYCLVREYRRALTGAIRHPRFHSSIESRFEDLKDQWKGDTAFVSSVTELVMHPAYQQIIGLGPRVLPLILRSLRDETDHWFWALAAITGEDPVPPTERGRVKAMRSAWLAWGESMGYVIDE